MKNQQIPAWVKGTAIEAILNFKGPLIEPKTPVKDDEKVLDEMNEYEKNLFSLIQSYAEKREAELKSKEGKIDLKELTPPSVEEFAHRAHLDLLMSSLTERIPKIWDNMVFGQLAFRQGFKIVKEKKTSEQLLFEKMDSLFSVSIEIKKKE